MVESYISLRNINKIYQNGVHAVHDFNLEISKNEFIVFVGPSGCGKSTTLRMIAGLEDISSGDLFINGLLANGMSPKDRDIAMVFQSYALYPHMSIYNNLAFGLKMRKTSEPKVDKNGSKIIDFDFKRVKKIEKDIKAINHDILVCEKAINKYGNNTDLESKDFLDKTNEILEKLQKELLSKEKELDFYKNNKVQIYRNRKYTKQEIAERVDNAANILEISQYLNSKPRELSGGQRQRVALGRAIVRKAKVFLMDEPLSNLDAKLRVNMRSEIIALHKKIEATTIYVTHDQTEAMTMADRIVVMKDGYIQQIGTPKEIYNYPKNTFVATFIGSPAMNILDCSFNNDVLEITTSYKIKLNKEFLTKVNAYYNDKIKKFKDEIRRLEAYKQDLDKKISDEKNLFKLNKLKKSLRKLEENYSSSAEILEKLEEINKKENKNILVGIRPEDIKFEKGLPYKLNVNISELLGNEYYVHGDIDGKKVVAKITSKETIKSGDVLETQFDESVLHYFDPILKERII